MFNLKHPDGPEPEDFHLSRRGALAGAFSAARRRKNRARFSSPRA